MKKEKLAKKGDRIMANKLMSATFLVDTEKLEEVGESFADALTWCEDSGLYLESYEELPPLNLAAIESKTMDALEEEYCLEISQGKYIFDEDLKRLFADSNIRVAKLISVNTWNTDKSGELLGIAVLEQNGKKYICQEYVEDATPAFDIAHVKELGRVWVVQSREEELGTENFFLYVPKEVKEEDVRSALCMAADYAGGGFIYDSEKGKEVFDEHYETMKFWADASGQFRFNHYIKFCKGWSIEPQVPDFAYEW